MTQFNERPIRSGGFAKDYSWWNNSVQHLVLSFDPEWADLNIGFYIFENHGYEMSFVVDGQNRTTYSSVEDKRTDTDAFTTLSHGVDRLIREARATPMNQPEPASGLLAIDGKVVMVGVSAVTLEENAQIELPPGPRSVIIYVKWLDQAFLDSVAESLPLTDLRFEPSAATPSAAIWPLTAADGTVLGRLVWQPPQPGWEFLRSVTPSLAIAIAVICMFTWIVLRHARQARLEQWCSTASAAPPKCGT